MYLCLMWQAVVQMSIEISLPFPSDHWCVGGDFNMLETLEDIQGGSSITVQSMELAA